MNLHTKQKQIHRCRKETMVTEEEGRSKRKVGINIYSNTIYKIDNQ